MIINYALLVNLFFTKHTKPRRCARTDGTVMAVQSDVNLSKLNLGGTTAAQGDTSETKAGEHQGP